MPGREDPVRETKRVFVQPHMRWGWDFRRPSRTMYQPSPMKAR